MQEQLLRKVSDLEAENNKLQGNLKEREVEIKRLQSEKDAQKKASDTEVSASLSQMLSQGISRYLGRLAWPVCPVLVHTWTFLQVHVR